MPESQALTTVLYIASICVILLTIGAGVAGFFVFRVLKSAHEILETIREEVLVVKGMRLRAIERVRFAKKWLRLMGERIMK